MNQQIIFRSVFSKILDPSTKSFFPCTNTMLFICRMNIFIAIKNIMILHRGRITKAMKYWRQRLHKSSELQASYGSREISANIVGRLSWNLKAAEKEERSPLRMKISGTLVWKRFHETRTKCLRLTVHAIEPGQQKSVNWKLVCYEKEREREKSRWDLRDSKFLSRILNFVVEGGEQNKWLKSIILFD